MAKSLAEIAFATGKPFECGIKEVITLIESERARLVIIANDVDSIEIVVCLPLSAADLMFVMRV
jgi:ribosomal protein L7Ae-like RNA K-turn-binding protein